MKNNLLKYLTLIIVFVSCPILILWYISTRHKVTVYT